MRVQGIGALIIVMGFASPAVQAVTHNRPVESPLEAAGVRRVINLGTNPSAYGDSARSLVAESGGGAFFVTGTEGEGRGFSMLSRTDGTAVGTCPVREFRHGPYSERWPYLLTVLGHQALFIASDDGGNHALWTSDGTPQGTALLRAFPEGNFQSYAVLGGRLYFFVSPVDGRRQFWTTDGTTAGTRMLLDLKPHYLDGLESLIVMGERLYFSGSSRNGYALWRSDGTAEGTLPVVDPLPGAEQWWSTTLDMTVAGGRLFYSVAGSGAAEWGLWVTDGTPEGTLHLAGPPSMEVPHCLTEAGGLLYCLTYSSVGAPTLWRSDGTPAGTFALAAVDAIAASDTDLDMGTLPDGAVLFRARDDEHGDELWRTDGTPEGTGLLKELRPGSAGSYPCQFTQFHGRLWFSARWDGPNNALWVSDGTAEGTRAAVDFAPLHRGANLWLMASTGPHLLIHTGIYQEGGKLWACDGTPEGTRTLWNGRHREEGGSILVLEAFTPGKVWMRTAPAGGDRMLWMSDGSAAGTLPLARTAQSEASFYPATDIIPAGEGAYFAGTDEAHGDELWWSDGTPEGTRMVADAIPGPAGSIGYAFEGAMRGGVLYYPASDGVHHLEPWRSDGTAAGTRMVADLNPSQSVPKNFAVEGETLLFTATRSDQDEGLWTTDGTEPGTQLLASFGSGRYDADAGMPAFLGDGRAALFVRDRSRYFWDLWATDGTPGGTEIVEELYAAEYGNYWTPGALFPFAGRVWFRAAPWDGDELWVSDGTENGTFLFMDIHPGDGGALPGDFAALGDRFYFRADDGVHGAELWASDGTEAGTFLLADLCPGPCSGYPMGMASDGERIVFSATDGLLGHELWSTDGTENGTVLVADILSGPASSAPERITPSGPTVYFTADDGRTGRELWRYDSGSP